LRTAFITGTGGFIGFHLAELLLQEGWAVAGFDGMTDYYDVRLKERRIEILSQHPKFTFTQAMLEDNEAVQAAVAAAAPDIIVHLAAQAGVRYSLENPRAYIDANIVGTFNVMEAARAGPVQHLLMASTSSVYGANTEMPFSETQKADTPLTIYAATKKANEAMGHSYAHIYGLPTTMFRFFTVYGPWGRPDMALFLFTKKILAGEPIDVFNYGNHRRDFTYIDDIVEGVIRTLDHVAPSNPNWDGNKPDPATSKAPYRIYNIGSNSPVELLRYIEILENCLGKKAIKNLLPLQAGDVPDTYADVDALMEDVDYKPSTPIELGVENFVKWYRDYYKA
jgi:UDP-glucuronate 4-epimerase